MYNIICVSGHSIAFPQPLPPPSLPPSPFSLPPPSFPPPSHPFLLKVGIRFVLEPLKGGNSLSNLSILGIKWEHTLIEMSN